MSERSRQVTNFSSLQWEQTIRVPEFASRSMRVESHTSTRYCFSMDACRHVTLDILISKGFTAIYSPHDLPPPSPPTLPKEATISTTVTLPVEEMVRLAEIIDRTGQLSFWLKEAISLESPKRCLASSF